MMRMGREPRSEGFTLMELMIVVIILGILATLAFQPMNRALERGRQAEARAILGQIYQAERLYYAERDTYIDATPTANPLMSTIPLDNSTENYFAYAVTGASVADFTATATRKDATATAVTATTGGKIPPWGKVYTITISATGEYVIGNVE